MSEIGMKWSQRTNQKEKKRKTSRFESVNAKLIENVFLFCFFFSVNETANVTKLAIYNVHTQNIR